MTPQTRLVYALPSLTSANRVKSRSTHLEKTALRAGPQRTRHACASQLLAFVSLPRHSQPKAHAPRFVLAAKATVVSVMMAAGLARDSMPLVIILVSALQSWTSVQMVKILSTRQARNAQVAGRQRTMLATASQRSVSVNHQQSYPLRALVPTFAQDVKTSTASAQMVHAGLAKASTRPEITPASALPSWISARMARSQCTHQARTARIAGRKRTRHACASPHLASAMRLLRLSFEGSDWPGHRFQDQAGQRLLFSQLSGVFSLRESFRQGAAFACSNLARD